MRTIKVAFACGVALSAIAASAVTTNVWTGAESGGMWNVQDNWSETLEPTVTTVYDFSRLTDGAVVTNNYVFTKGTAEQLKIAGLIFGESKGTVTLFGTSNSETIFVNPNPSTDKTVVVDIPSGTTFDCQLRHTTTPWKDQSSILVFNSPGTVKFSGAQFVPTMWTVKFACSGASAIFANVTNAFRTSRLQFDNISRTTVSVDGDFWIGDVADGKWPSPWPAEANRIVGDGVSTLRICSGYGLGNGTAVKYTMITNFHSVAMSGGGSEWRRAPIFANRYIFSNYALDHGREYVFQNNPVNNINGGIQFVPNAAVDIDGPARLRTYCNQILSTLSGTGTHGSFDVGGTWNNQTDKVVAPGSLTVGEGIASATSTVFNARLTGMGGGFVKKGSDYNLTLTGANTYTGSTQVAEGRLTLKRDIAYDSAWWWSFDGEDLSEPKLGGVKIVLDGAVSSTDGVRSGTRAVHLDGLELANLHLKITQNFKSLIGNNPHTIQLWIRPKKEGCYAAVSSTGAKMTYIADLGSNWGDDFTRSRILLIKANTDGDDYSLVFTSAHYNSKIVDAGLGVNVPIKGEELFDGKWHQLTYVYGREDRLVEAYVDGVLKGYDTLSSSMDLPDNSRLMLGYSSEKDRNNYFSGGMDEVKVLPRAMSAAEVLRSMVFANAQNSLPVPEPVMQWKFDNADDIGADSCEVAQLSQVEGLAAPSLCNADFAIEGKALEKQKPMHTAIYPECMPTGSQPFTVSCRYMPNGNVENTPIVWWGNPSKAYGYFRVQTTDAVLRAPGVGYHNKSSLISSWSGQDGTPIISHSTGVTPTGDYPSGWVDFTASYDNVSKKVKLYVDGALVGTKSGVKLDIERGDGRLHVGYQTIGTTTKLFPGIIDDIQIYDRALSDEEVRLAVRSLHGENLDRVIVNSPVSVSEGATLAFAGPGHTLSALSSENGTVHIEHESDFTMNEGAHVLGKLTGGGLLNLPENCDLTVSDASDFVGTVNLSGGASFAMSSTGDAMSANVYAEEGACLKAAQQTAPIRTTGRVVLPSSVTVELPSVAYCDFPMYLAEAGGITMGDDIEWQFRDSQGDLLPEFRSACFRIEKDETGLVVRKFRKEGATVLIR